MDLRVKAWQLPPRLITGAYFITKENESSWIFEPRLTCSNTLRRVQNPGFSLVLPGRSQTRLQSHQ